MRNSIFSYVKNNLDINKPTKITLYIIFASIPIFVAGMFLWGTFLGGSGKESFLNRVKPEHFNGKVDTLYFDKGNHNTKTAVLSCKVNFQLYPQWEPEIEVGDSLSKVNGSFKIYVYKNNGGEITLDYRDVVKDWKD